MDIKIISNGKEHEAKAVPVSDLENQMVVIRARSAEDAEKIQEALEDIEVLNSCNNVSFLILDGKIEIETVRPTDFRSIPKPVLRKRLSRAWQVLKGY